MYNIIVTLFIVCAVSATDVNINYVHVFVYSIRDWFIKILFVLVEVPCFLCKAKDIFSFLNKTLRIFMSVVIILIMYLDIFHKLM